MFSIMCFSSFKNPVNDIFFTLLMTGNESFRASVGQRWKFHFSTLRELACSRISLLRAALERSPNIQNFTKGLDQIGKAGAGEHMRNTCPPGWEFKNMGPFTLCGTIPHQKLVCVHVFCLFPALLCLPQPEVRLETLSINHDAQ